MGIFQKIFGDPNEKYLKKIQPLVEKINSLERKFEKLSDEELKGKTFEFKERLKKGETLDEILPEAFATVREAAKRTLGQRHFDVQVMGAIALHQGKVVEMKTGEGKTLVATMPLYLNALEGKGCHLVTVNDYLARRDTVWMGQIYHFLGLSVGCLNHEQSFLYDPEYKKPTEEKEKLRDELGSFYVVEDFLRPCSRKEAYLADITYGTNNEFGFDYLRDHLVYSVEEMVQTRNLNPNEKYLNYAIIDEVDSILIDEARTPLIISAPDTESSGWYQEFAKITPKLKREIDYKVDEKFKIITLTEEGIEKVEKILNLENIYTERGVRYLHHLEQALRAEIFFKRDVDYVVKDGKVIIVDEFTGRLLPGRRWSQGLHQAVEAKEGVPVQPESITLATISFQNYFRLYKKIAGMTGTAATAAEEFYKVYRLETVVIPTHRPMIRKDWPDKIFKSEKEKMKAIVEEIKKRHQKGQPVLVGTRSIEKNEKLSALLQKEKIPHQVLNAKNHEKEGQIIAQAGKFKAVTIATNMAGRGVDIILGGNPPDPKEAEKVKSLGGLFVLGTERHEARRIDDQLRGRAGRQGDPGETQFFLSLEDELIRIFGGEQVKKLMEKLNVPEGTEIQSSLVTKLIDDAQARVEGMNFDARKYLLEYDDVLNVQRETIYKKRNEILILSAEELKKKFFEIFKKFHLSETILKEKETLLGQNFLPWLKLLYLNVVDRLWVDHLQALDYLREVVRIRAFGQKDPLLEYKSEAKKMFQSLLEAIDAMFCEMVMKTEVKKEVEVSCTSKKIGRNDPCPCGSGKKYKKCCWPKFGS